MKPMLLGGTLGLAIVLSATGTSTASDCRELLKHPVMRTEAYKDNSQLFESNRAWFCDQVSESQRDGLSVDIAAGLGRALGLDASRGRTFARSLCADASRLVVVNKGVDQTLSDLSRTYADLVSKCLAAPGLHISLEMEADPSVLTARFTLGASRVKEPPVTVHGIVTGATIKGQKTGTFSITAQVGGTHNLALTRIGRSAVTVQITKSDGLVDPSLVSAAELPPSACVRSVDTRASLPRAEFNGNFGYPAFEAPCRFPAGTTVAVDFQGRLSAPVPITGHTSVHIGVCARPEMTASPQCRVTHEHVLNPASDLVALAGDTAVVSESGLIVGYPRLRQAAVRISRRLHAARSHPRGRP